MADLHLAPEHIYAELANGTHVLAYPAGATVPEEVADGLGFSAPAGVPAARHVEPASVQAVRARGVVRLYLQSQRDREAAEEAGESEVGDEEHDDSERESGAPRTAKRRAPVR